MREAIAVYATRVVEKLREWHQAAQLLTVFMHANCYTENPWYVKAQRTRL